MAATSERNPGLIADPVFLGITRPPMRWGVTYSALLVCGMVSVETFLLTHNLLWLLIWIPLHGLSYLACLREPRFFDLLLVWGQTRGPALVGNLRFWHASSYSPLPTDLPDQRGHRRHARTAAPIAVLIG